MKLVVAGVVALLVTFGAAAQALEVKDPGAKGPYEVGFATFVLVDASRPSDGSPYPGRPIPLMVWYPADAPSVTGLPEALYPLDAVSGRAPRAPSSLFEAYGTDGAYQEPPVSSDAPFPLVIFSPGSNCIPFYHVSFGTRLASHGFVVAVPYHWGSGFWAWERRYGNSNAIDGFHRPRDLSFILTNLLSYNESPGHLLHGAIRPDQVAAGGWSLGGYTAMALAGGDDMVCDVVANPAPGTCVASMPDPRFRAIVSMDGSATFLHWSELARVTVPSLVMGREWSTLAALAGAGGSPSLTTSVARPHAAFRGHPNIRLDVLGTNHQSFSDFCQLIGVLRDLGIITPQLFEDRRAALCTGVTDSNDVHRLTGLYSIAFLRTALAGEPGLDHLLTPGWALTREPLAEVFETEKRSPNAAEDECMGGVIGCPEPQLFLYFPHQPGGEQARAAKDPAASAFVEPDDPL